jgi:Domain of unknown function (DUF4920)
MKRRAMKMSALVGAVLILGAAGLAAEEAVVGKGVQVAETTSMAKILADPDSYVGKTVRIEGRVLDVCPMKGCWMELEEVGAKSRLRVKVEDGVLVFPVTAKGKLAVAEGKLEALPMTRDQYVGWLEHLAEERGETFDASKVGEGPFRILQLQGTGARIGES